MINNIYSLKNILSGRYNDIFEYPTDAYAEARVKEWAGRENSGLRLDEVELYRLGTVDVESGKIVSLEEPILIQFDNKSIIEKEEETAKTTE